LQNLLCASSVGLAAVARALNKKTEAKTYLKKYLPLVKKHRCIREELILKQLLGSDEPIPEELLQIPPLHLLNLLVRTQRSVNIGDYRKAFRYAQRQRLLGLLHRWIVFFPAPIVRLLEKGKQTGLPKAILRFPIFNQNTPVYHLRFLGDVVITKHQQAVRTKLSPKEKAFLIHLALRAGAPGKLIPLRDLYRNFWKQSPKPQDTLLHLLTQLKKDLLLPSHLLSVSSIYAEPRLINRGMYITTDYGELETLLTQVKSLKRGGEWNFAKRDYERAFKLVRGEPFKKLYDPWSESMHHAILETIEDAVRSYLHMCREHKQQEVHTVLAKMRAFVPNFKKTISLQT
jgi:hypothetical protein